MKIEDKVKYIAEVARNIKDVEDYNLFIEFLKMLIMKKDHRKGIYTFLEDCTKRDIDIIYNSLMSIINRTKILGDKKWIFAKSLVSHKYIKKGDFLIFSYKKGDLYAFLDAKDVNSTHILEEGEFYFLNSK